MAAGERRAREAGFTLLEMLIAAAVLLVGLLLAADLLDESGRLLHHSVRRAQDPTTLLAAELLRNDLRGARLPPETAGQWVALPLVLEVPATGFVVWRWSDGELFRGLVGGAERPVLRGVSAFRWRGMGGGAVEVEVVLRGSGAWASALAGELPRADRGRAERLRLLVTAGVERSGW